MNDPTHITRPSARVEVDTEAELAHGWTYRVLVHREGEPASAHTVTLAWCDHDYWSGGRIAPSRVVQAVVEYALAHAAALPAKFDAARVRRWTPRVDAELRGML